MSAECHVCEADLYQRESSNGSLEFFCPICTGDARIKELERERDIAVEAEQILARAILQLESGLGERTDTVFANNDLLKQFFDEAAAAYRLLRNIPRKDDQRIHTRRIRTA